MHQVRVPGSMAVYRVKYRYLDMVHRLLNQLPTEASGAGPSRGPVPNFECRMRALEPRNGRTPGLLLVACVILSTLVPAHAERRTSLEQAVNEARERYPGRVLSAETRREAGREAHRIRILTDDGRVKRLEMDAESGRFERRPRR